MHHACDRFNFEGARITQGVTVKNLRNVRVAVCASIFALIAGASTGIAYGEGPGSTEGERVTDQEQLEGMTYQIDMSSVENDTEVTLQDNGTIVASQAGQKMTVRQDGSWSIAYEEAPEGTAARGDWGACAGSFVNVYVNVEDDLQWGGQQVCESTSQRPHKVDVTLRQGPNKPLSQQKNKITVKGKYSYGRTANNYVYSPCLNHVEHRASVVATPYAGGTQWPKVVSTDTVVKCNTR